MVRRIEDTISQKPLENYHGFTLIELMIAIAILGVLVAIAAPNFISYRYKAQIAAAISEIKLIEKAISIHVADDNDLPDSLSDIARTPTRRCATSSCRRSSVSSTAVVCG